MKMLYNYLHQKNYGRLDTPTLKKAAKATCQSKKIQRLKETKPLDTPAQEEVHPGNKSISSNIPWQD